MLEHCREIFVARWRANANYRAGFISSRSDSPALGRAIARRSTLTGIQYVSGVIARAQILKMRQPIAVCDRMAPTVTAPILELKLAMEYQSPLPGIDGHQDLEARA